MTLNKLLPQILVAYTIQIQPFLQDTDLRYPFYTGVYFGRHPPRVEIVFIVLKCTAPNHPFSDVAAIM